MQLQKGLKAIWNLKGDFNLIDIGYDYFIVKFACIEDYKYIFTQGPWLIGDSYLTIRKWIPNFVPSKEPIRILIAWIKIPRISVEYPNKEFLDKIGEKVGKVRGIDKTTVIVERGQFTKLSVEIDLAKPLLSKFRMNGRIWRIQYEGLRMVCFNCGKVGHKEESCPLNENGSHNELAQEM